MTSTNHQDEGVSRHSAERETTPRSSLDWARETGIAGKVIREMDARVRQKHRVRRRRRIAAASSAVVLFLAVGAWLRPGRLQVADPVHASDALVAAPARQQLTDGSIVELNEGASIKVDYTDTLRRVVLERGEAYFQVVKHDRRPFLVAARDIEARAVGTAFIVQLRSEAVEVLVTEGRVAVDQLSEGSPIEQPSPSRGLAPTPQTIATIDAGSRVTVETAPFPPVARPLVLEVPPEEMANRLSWRVPRLEFSGTSLSEALALFNKYSAIHLVLGDQQLGKLKLSGIVRADNTDTLLQLLHAEFGLTVERRTGTEILLNRVSAGPKSN